MSIVGGDGAVGSSADTGVGVATATIPRLRLDDVKIVMVRERGLAAHVECRIENVCRLHDADLGIQLLV